MNTKTLLLSTTLFVWSFIFSQKTTLNTSLEDEKTTKSTSSKLEDILKNSTKIEGVFTLYQDNKDGSVRILINEDQLDQEYIYFGQIANGTAEGGRYVKGTYKKSIVFKFEKYFDRIDAIKVNTSYYFDEKSPLAKSKDTNISDAILESFKIEYADEKEKNYLIKINNLFVKETFLPIKRPLNPKKAKPTDFTLGELNSKKSKIKNINNYSDNLNILSELVYSKKTPLNSGSKAISDARNISIQLFHSIIKMPENDYIARKDDARIGYFITQIDDQTSKETIHYKDLIHRWHLKKKNPDATISEPVEPIVWWIENTTPYEFRDLIKEGVLRWNKAFEKAGFKNAMVVKIQPDDAEWDAGNIHYNVLRWTSSPKVPFGGYGPSFVNPKTGQILGADIMLEFAHHTNRVFYDKVFDEKSQNELEDHQYCSVGHFLHQNMQYGRTLLKINDRSEEELSKMQKQAMLELIMHEVGHTLGLNHNMKASYLYTPEQLYDKNFAHNRALAGSVMDYVAINFSPDPETQGDYYSTQVGPYDDWAIQYGYMPVKTERELTAIAERSNEPELIFGNDADDMRAPGKAMDPRVMIGDISNDPLKYGEDRMNFMLNKLASLKNKFYKKGDFYDDLRRGFYTLDRQYWIANGVISRYVGGVYINRSTMGQKGEKAPYTPVEYEKQKKAMQLLSQYAFAPDVFQLPDDLLNYTAKRRRGYSRDQDPKINEVVLKNQKKILDHLVHPNTLNRIVNSEAYGNEYTITEFLDDLTESIYKEDIKSTVTPRRQNLQIEYLDKLIGLLKNNTLSSVEKSAVFGQLYKINKMSKNKKGDDLSKAHKLFIQNKIKKIIE